MKFSYFHEIITFCDFDVQKRAQNLTFLYVSAPGAEFPPFHQIPPNSMKFHRFLHFCNF